jgi:hypothetical protein
MPKLTKKDPYKCPSCGYETPQKNDMRKHLFTLKKQCPRSKMDIELTPQIKDFILTNRVYHVPKNPHTVVINTYNQMNNFLSSIEVTDKLTHLFNYKQAEPVDFKDKMADILCPKSLELKNQDQNNFELKKMIY